MFSEGFLEGNGMLPSERWNVLGLLQEHGCTHVVTDRVADAGAHRVSERLALRRSKHVAVAEPDGIADGIAVCLADREPEREPVSIADD